MSGICGWYGQSGDSPQGVCDAMTRRFAWRDVAAQARIFGTGWCLAACGPPGTFAALAVGPVCVAVQGHPFRLRTPHPPERGSNALQAFCHELIDAWLDDDSRFLVRIGGDFALALVDQRRGSVLLAIDRIGIRSLVYQCKGETLVFGASSDIVLAHPIAAATIEPQSIYDYVYFHMVPGPATAYREQSRLQPGHKLMFARGRAMSEAYWQMRYSEPGSGRIADFKPAFRAALDASVADFAGTERCGAFLSGGTDSSTVAGTLGRVTGAPARTYSIGFAATGYDEMAYARTTASHFGTDHHEYYVTPDDVVQAAPLIAGAYDQPFGNASAIPTYFCARLAQGDGVARLLGGDGGDELFGGNSRYAKQCQLARYERLPAMLRRKLIEPMLLARPALARAPLLGKVVSYVAQASLPMPARLESYNLLQRLGPENVFSTDFLASVDRDGPLAQLGAAYAATHAQSAINRMLGLDLKFTLADNDLPKVTRTCDLAGVDVAFPLLHEDVVDLSARLPPDFKLRGTELRWFFKQALSDFLPRATIAKKKHGFGLPAGVWLRDHPPLHELAGDSMATLSRRGIFRHDLFDPLLTERLADHPGYYGTLLWVLMMLELWFQAHASRGTVTPQREP